MFQARNRRSRIANTQDTDLRIYWLRLDVGDRVIMTQESKDACFCPHVPHTRRGIAAACHEHVQGGVQAETVDAAEMAVVVANDLDSVNDFDHEKRNKQLHSPHTLLYSRSQHLIILSSPAENKYGWRALTARPRTGLM
jgi:hypothetical protein